MIKLHPDFKEFIELLNAAKAEYLVVGAFAMAFHGYPRYTGDIDIWVNNSAENAAKIYRVVREFGFTQDNVKEKDFSSNDNIVQLGYPPVRIDILTGVEGLDFDSANKNRKERIFNDVFVKFLCMKDLKVNKKAVGRTKDLADLEILRKRKTI